MRVVFLSDTFPEGMGYAGLLIPKTLARMGVDVHYVTAGLPVYHSMANYDEVYRDFHGPRDAPGTSRIVEGYHVHFLDWHKTYGGVRLKELRKILSELQPDVVQTLGHVTWPSLQAAWLKPSLGFKLFTGNHTTASVYPLANRNSGPFDPLRIKEYLIRTLPGRFISRRAELCYGATSDCSDVAHRFMGVPMEKLTTVPLGVETEVFHPAVTAEDQAAAIACRRELGVGGDEILCVYTGRFTDDKNPLLLARAVADLRAAGEPYRAVFYGEGPQRTGIAAQPDTIVRAFVPYTELGDLYRAADIGVWPTQESTSMIDCAASGTPIIVNDTIAAVERVEGNGLKYRLNDLDDLKRALLELKTPAARKQLGEAGARKMEEQYSWRSLVRRRLDDFEKSLRSS